MIEQQQPGLFAADAAPPAGVPVDIADKFEEIALNVASRGFRRFSAPSSWLLLPAAANRPTSLLRLPQPRARLRPLHRRPGRLVPATPARSWRTPTRPSSSR